MHPSPSPIEVTVAGRQLLFSPVLLTFIAHGISDVFTKKNNKSLKETLAHPRYKSLLDHVVRQHSDAMDLPLGNFLAELKIRGDNLYRKFLNPHGDKTYCQFRMSEGPEKRQKGLYLYVLNDEIVYIGRSFDPFSKRIDQGYGKIHPKNCFIDGQSTNCHLNSLISTQSENVNFFVCSLQDDSEIESVERALIQIRKPLWNIALPRKNIHICKPIHVT